MERDDLAIEYENGVADVLAFLAGDSAVVERDVKLHGRHSAHLRQLDVQVRGRIFGIADASMVVDCKRWGRPVNVVHAGAFLDLVEDVGADIGLLVTTGGASRAARTRLRSARGARVEVMTLRELAAWRPRGTVTTCYRVPKDRKAAAERSLRQAGFRVMTEPEPRLAADEVGLCAFRHYGTNAPSSDVQQNAWDQAARALTKAGVQQVEILNHGVIAGGGTPGHRWLEVAADGVPVGLKILAASEIEVREQLDQLRLSLSQRFGHPMPDVLDVVRPERWPVESMFGGHW